MIHLIIFLFLAINLVASSGLPTNVVDIDQLIDPSLLDSSVKSLNARNMEVDYIVPEIHLQYEDQVNEVISELPVGKTTVIKMKRYMALL